MTIPNLHDWHQEILIIGFLFNNYGNNPALSSDVISYGEVPDFVYDNPNTFQQAPQNLDPVNTSINES